MSEYKTIMKYYEKLLRDFCITMTPEIRSKIRELYPNEIAIENYIMPIILKSLGE